MKKFKTWKKTEVEFKEVKDATGVKGIILGGGFFKHVFRVYDKENLDEKGNWTFHDYPIAHDDLEVQIIDKNAAFYHKEDGTVYLDHSPRVLGWKEIDD